MYDIEKLNNKKVSELRAIADELNIQKADKLKKQELVYKILDEQALKPSSEDEKKENLVKKAEKINSPNPKAKESTERENQPNKKPNNQERERHLKIMYQKVKREKQLDVDQSVGGVWWIGVDSLPPTTPT